MYYSDNNMENFIFTIDDNQYETLEYEQVSDINSTLRNELHALKNDIVNDKNWDIAKRRVNEYENIFSSSKKKLQICTKRSISRAYFKLWEVLMDFHLKIFTQKSSKAISVANIAEGPGGFIECLVDYKERFQINFKCFHGITLLSQQYESVNKVPFWKLSKTFCHTNNVHLNRKNDNIGNLYDIRNINNYISKVGRNTCDLVTADGGFDFSMNFNNQEDMFQRLLLSEIYTACIVQSFNGTFIVKIFDMFTYETVCLISILKMFYNEINIVKPFTSRPANSEKYFVCVGFKGHQNRYEILNDCRNEIINRGGIKKSLGKYYSKEVATRLCIYNKYYTARQKIYLRKTLEESEKLKYLPEDTKLDVSTETIDKCQKWCEMYQIDYSLDSF